MARDFDPLQVLETSTDCALDQRATHKRSVKIRGRGRGTNGGNKGVRPPLAAGPAWAAPMTTPATDSQYGRCGPIEAFFR